MKRIKELILATVIGLAYLIPLLLVGSCDQSHRKKWDMTITKADGTSETVAVERVVKQQVGDRMKFIVYQDGKRYVIYPSNTTEIRIERAKDPTATKKKDEWLNNE